jgi:hypothetical protein
MDPNYMEVFRILTIKMKNSGDPLEPLPLVGWLPYLITYLLTSVPDPDP